MLNLELDWDRPARTGTVECRHTLRVRIVPGNTGTTLPLRLAIALDVSGSMEGAKLQHAKAACEAVTRLLRPEDRLWLAGFSTGVKEILGDQAGGSDACDRVRDAIASLQASGVTRTDLALDWIRTSLRPDAGVARVGILITDGHATNPMGTPLQGEDLSTLVTQAGTVGEGGITLCAVGMGDAKEFNTAFLTDLTDRGRGEFIYAADPAQLQPRLEGRLRASQAVAVNQAFVTLKPVKTGVKVEAVCRYRPEYAALESSSAGTEPRYAIGALAAGAPTDILVQVTTPALGFGERLGSHEVVEITVDDGTNRVSNRASIRWTNSLIEAQELNEDVDRDRLLWETNVYAGMLQRTSDPQRTADILNAIRNNAIAAGRQDLADRATRDLDELAKQGVLPAHRTTSMLDQVRKTGGQT